MAKFAKNVSVGIFSFSLFHTLHAAKYSTSRQMGVYCKKCHCYHG